jgi:hypothetical protein
MLPPFAMLGVGCLSAMALMACAQRFPGRVSAFSQLRLTKD